MTQIIEFKHCGETIRSIAILSFEESDYSAIVMPYAHKEELGNTIVITRSNKNWVSEASVVKAYQLTYLNILNELDMLVIQHENFNKMLGIVCS